MRAVGNCRELVRTVQGGLVHTGVLLELMRNLLVVLQRDNLTYMTPTQTQKKKKVKAGDEPYEMTTTLL